MYRSLSLTILLVVALSVQLSLLRAVSAQQPIPLSPCIYGRVVGGYDVPPPPPSSEGGAHPAAWPQGTLDGTCHYGSAQSSLPAWYSAGYLAGADDETYNGFPWTSTPTDVSTSGVGKACGECFQLFGDAGTITVMNVDVCDKGYPKCQGSTGGPLGPKDVPTFLVHSAVFSQLTGGNGGGVPIAIRKVSCDMSGTNVGVVLQYATEGNPSMTYFRLRVYGSRVGISDVSIRGPAGGATGGNWVSLQRFWEGTFNWTNRGDIGGAFQIQITSIFNETLTYPGTIAASDLQANKMFDFGAQFALPVSAQNGGSTSDTSCQYPGPDPAIYTDRLGGDNFNFWSDYGSSVASPNFAETTGCYRGPNCISFKPSNPWDMLQLSPSGEIGAKQSQYGVLSFWARSDTPTDIQVQWGWKSGLQQIDISSNMLPFTTSSTWTQFTFQTANFWANLGTNNWLSILRFQLQGGGSTSVVYLDDIALAQPSSGLLYWVAEPSLASSPPLGQCGYTGPTVCCYANQSAVYDPQGPLSPSPPLATAGSCATTTPPITTIPLPTSSTASTGTTTVASSTSPAPTQTNALGCALPQPNIPGVSCQSSRWIVVGDTALSSVQLNGAPATINGSLTILPTATLSLDLSKTTSILTVTGMDTSHWVAPPHFSLGNVTLDGVLQIQPSALVAVPDRIPLAYVSGSLLGSFQEIQVPSSRCYRYSGTTELRSGLLSVLISAKRTCKKKSKLPSWAIAILAIGIVAIVATVTFFVAKHYRDKTGGRRRIQVRLDRESHGSH